MVVYLYFARLQARHDQRCHHGLGVVPGDGAADERYHAPAPQHQLVPAGGRGGGGQPQHLLRPH